MTDASGLSFKDIIQELHRCTTQREYQPQIEAEDFVPLLFQLAKEHGELYAISNYRGPVRFGAGSDVWFTYPLSRSGFRWLLAALGAFAGSQNLTPEGRMGFNLYGDMLNVSCTMNGRVERFYFVTSNDLRYSLYFMIYKL